MPLTAKDRELKRHFTDEYGDDRGERVYYATLNKRINQGRAIKVPESRRLKSKRRHHRGLKRTRRHISAKARKHRRR